MADDDKPIDREGERDPDDRLEEVLAELGRPGGFLEQMSDLLDRYARYYGIGEWRLQADVVDSAQATVIRRILNPAKRIPEHLPAYARAVFRHLVKSGPTVALSRDAALSLGEEFEQIAAATDEPVQTPATTTQRLPRDLGSFRLTEHEQRAIDAFALEKSNQKRADRSGMSEWNYRTRIKRAIAKIRKGIARAGDQGAAGDAREIS